MLRRFKNAILEGLPTGKSYVVDAVAAVGLRRRIDRSRARVGKYAITLHLSTTYEVVEGLRRYEQ